MTTTRLQNGKAVKLSIEEKARLLTVISNHPDLQAGELAVSSGSIKNAAYVVKHDGRHVLSCSCDAYCLMCSHAVAAQWHLEAASRASFQAAFNPNNID